MLNIEPAYLLKPTKSGDVRVPYSGMWEATYGDGKAKWSEWSTVIRPCPLAAAADCLSNAVIWMLIEGKKV